MSSVPDAQEVTVTIHQPECLPWLGLVEKLRQCEVFVLLDCVQFEKNYFQNRNKIRTAWGWAWLTVPVLTKGASGQPIRQVRIRNDEAWRRKHLQSFLQHYGAAPYFDRYFPDLQALYARSWDRLEELNTAVMQWMAGAFGLSRQFVRASELPVSGTRSELLASICRAVGATTYLSGVSGRDYLDERLFAEAGIAVRYQDFQHPVYRQCYEPFLPNMSAVDLLFNVGPQSLDVLTQAQGIPRESLTSS